MQEKLKNHFGKVRQSKSRRLSIMLIICITFSLCSVMGITAFAATRPSDIADNTKYHEMLTDGIFSSQTSWKGIDRLNNPISKVEVDKYSNYVSTAPTKPTYYQTTSNNVLELNGYSGNYPETIYQKVKVIPGSKVYISYQYTKRTNSTASSIVQSMLLSAVPASSFNGTTTVYAEANLTRDIFANNKLTDVTVLSGNATVSNGTITAGSSWSEIYAEYQVPSDVYEVYVAFHGVSPSGSTTATNDTTVAVGNILAYASARTATIDTVYVSAAGSDASGNGSESSPFKSLELASYWVSEGGKIVLLDDVSGDMTADKPFTLDLNGHAVTGNLTVNSAGNLTITDSSSAETGKITGNVSSSSGSTVSINSGRIDGTLTLSGTASITGGTFNPKPAASYIASGYGCVANSDGSYTVKSISDIRSSAVDEIEKALSDTKNTINQMTGLTDAEKDALIKEAENASDSAKSAIESATSADSIESAKSSGIAALKKVEDNAGLQNAKNEAADAIDEAVTANKAAIDALENLSNDEKTALKNELDDAATAAKAAIDAATSTDAVSTAKANGIEDLDIINAKAEAIDAVNKKLADETAVVNGLENLSDSEKEKLISELNTAAADTKDTINASTTIDSINTAETNGFDKMNIIDGKAKAIDEINKKSAVNKAAIDALENLSNDEKTALKNELDDAATAAKAAIDEATSTDAVSTAKANGIEDLDIINAKAEAIDAVNKKLADETAVVNGLENLSDSEKEKLISELNTAAAKAKAAIDEATSTDAVSTAKTDGIEDLDIINAKAEAIDAVNKELSDTKTAIAQMADLSDDERVIYSQAADEYAGVARNAISNATSQEEVISAKDNGIATLELNKDRATTTDEINRKLADTLAAIDALEYLNSEEKAVQKAAAKDAADTAYAAVSNAGADDFTDILEALSESLKDVMDYAISADFIDAHLNDNSDGTVYDDVNSANIDRIFSGQESWNNLTDKQKEIVNQTIAALNEEKTDVEYQTYQDYLDAVVAAIEDSKTSFIEQYVSDEQGNIYKESTVNNYEQLFSGKETWDELSQAEKDAIDEALVAAGSKPYEKLLNEAKDAVDSSAEDFIGKYVSDSNGNIYKQSTDKNYAQIISGLETWNNMNQAEKDAVNQRLTAEAGGKTYEELLQQAQDYLDTVTNAFIKEHMTDDAGSVIIAVSKDTYDNILNGESDFNKLSQDQKDEVNRKLKEAGSEKTYEELLAEAKKAVNASADDFIDKYVSNDKKNIYKSANKDNYKQILSGEDVWDSLTQSEKDAINKALLAAGGKSYEELLAEAKNIEALVNSSNTEDSDTVVNSSNTEDSDTVENSSNTGDSETVVNNPKTGDISNIMLWFILMLISGVGLIAVSTIRRKEIAK